MHRNLQVSLQFHTSHSWPMELCATKAFIVPFKRLKCYIKKTPSQLIYKKYYFFDSGAEDFFQPLMYFVVLYIIGDFFLSFQPSLFYNSVCLSVDLSV